MSPTVFFEYYGSVYPVTPKNRQCLFSSRGNLMIYHRDKNIPQLRMRTKTKEKKEKKSTEKKFAATASSQTKKAAKPKNSFSDEAKKLKSDVKCINEKLMKEGERLFFTRLPEKIIELTEYIQNQPLFKKSFNEVRQEIAIDKYVMAYMAECKEKELLKNVLETHKTFDDWRKKQKHLLLGCEIEGKTPHSDKKEKDHMKHPIPFPTECVIPINAQLSSMLDFLKKEVRECVVLCSAIKMWITLRIPKMEDGNDFSVAIQEECVDTISDVEDEAYSILNSICNYHNTRGSYIIEMVTNPSVLDYAKCISQVDETQFFNTKLSIQSFRNNYALIYDLVIKNLEKLQTPTTHVDSLFLY